MSKGTRTMATATAAPINESPRKIPTRIKDLVQADTGGFLRIQIIQNRK